MCTIGVHKWSSNRNIVHLVSEVVKDPNIIQYIYRTRSSALRRTPYLEDQVPVFTSSSDRVAQLYPRHGVPLPPSSRARRATVEVLLPASTRTTQRIKSV
jgi:hypothetical protein